MKRSWKNVLEVLSRATIPVSQSDLPDGNGMKPASGSRIREMHAAGAIYWKHHIGPRWGWCITDAGRQLLAEVDGTKEGK